MFTNLSTSLHKHLAKYEQRKRFNIGLSMFCVVAIKFHGTESNITAEKCLWVYCSLDDKKLPSKRLFCKITNRITE